MSTEPVAYEDVEARVRANQEAAAEAKAQTEVYTGIATERGIQCQKAHELIDLWFWDWDEEKAKRWAALAAAGGVSGDLTPNVDHVLALIGACLGFAPIHEIAPPAPPAGEPGPASDVAREPAEYTPTQA